MNLYYRILQYWSISSKLSKIWLKFWYIKLRHQLRNSIQPIPFQFQVAIIPQLSDQDALNYCKDIHVWETCVKFLRDRIHYDIVHFNFKLLHRIWLVWRCNELKLINKQNSTDNCNNKIKLMTLKGYLKHSLSNRGTFRYKSIGDSNICHKLYWWWTGTMTSCFSCKVGLSSYFHVYKATVFNNIKTFVKKLLSTLWVAFLVFKYPKNV